MYMKHFVWVFSSSLWFQTSVAIPNLETYFFFILHKYICYGISSEQFHWNQLKEILKLVFFLQIPRIQHLSAAWTARAMVLNKMLFLQPKGVDISYISLKKIYVLGTH